MKFVLCTLAAVLYGAAACEIPTSFWDAASSDVRSQIVFSLVRESDMCFGRRIDPPFRIDLDTDARARLGRGESVPIYRPFRGGWEKYELKRVGNVFQAFTKERTTWDPLEVKLSLHPSAIPP